MIASRGESCFNQVRGASLSVIVTEKSQLFSVTIVSWHPTTGGGTTDRSASSPARRMSGAPPSRKIAFLENITGPSHRPRELLLDLVQPQPPPFVSALLYHIQAYPPDIVYSDLVEGPLDE